MRKYRVYNFINVDDRVPAIHIPVSGPSDAITLIDALAEDQLQRPEIISNVFGLQVWDELAQEWVEWEDGEGEDINSYTPDGPLPLPTE